jgi:hypothetical protein
MYTQKEAGGAPIWSHWFGLAEGIALSVVDLQRPLPAAVAKKRLRQPFPIYYAAMSLNADPGMPLSRSAGAAPIRAPGSLRRTSSIDVSWPAGRAAGMTMVGRARDIVTPALGGSPVLCAQDEFEAKLASDRSVTAIQATPLRPALAGLVGERGGGGFRRAIERLLPEERRDGTPLYLILDDIAGTSLVAGWAWSHWDPNWLTNAAGGIDLEKAFRSRENVCIAYAPGSTAFDVRGGRTGAPVVDLRNPADPEGWHRFTTQEGRVGMRRARRIDIQLDDLIRIEAAFQDSATRPQGDRAAVHEYRLTATADPHSLHLLSVEADPRVLPHIECPSATFNLTRLLGTPLPELREKVLAQLRGPAGCTHLNDAMRALADVPALLKYLRS